MEPISFCTIHMMNEILCADYNVNLQYCTIHVQSLILFSNSTAQRLAMNGHNYALYMITCKIVGRS